MKLRTVELAVGGLMIVGILSLLMLALQVSGLGHLFKEEPGYKVDAEFSNIGGLKVRAKVSVAGVVVGRVVKITLEPETYNAKVEFTINPSRIDKLPSDTRASIMTSGLLGDNYLALTPGFDDNNLLQEGSLIPITNTDSAVVLEQLISKFVAGQVSKEDKEKKANKEDKEDEEDKENKEDKKDKGDKADKENEANKENQENKEDKTDKENKADKESDLNLTKHDE